MPMVKPVVILLRIRVFRILLAATLLAPGLSGAASPPGAAVASGHPRATAAGIEILERGGNAFDAAVAVTAALAVVEPSGSGLGGGGFWLLHRASDDHSVMLDGREKAPAAATESMYLDADGQYQREWSRDTPLAAGIPGEPAALAHLAQHYGRLTLAENLAPAIRLATDGFRVSEQMHKMLAFRAPVLRKSPAAAELFLTDAGEPLPVGTRVRQPDLANTLQAIADGGRDGFYTGAVARKMVDGVREAGGIWTLEDLADYDLVEREPITFSYGPYRVTSASPPSSGGIVLAEALHMLEGFDLAALSGVQRKHLAAEAMRRAYRDRAAWLGDSDFVQIPTDRLLSPLYAAGLRGSIRLDRASKSSSLTPPNAEHRPGKGEDTTHFSIIDTQGNRVSATLSVNFPFGAGFMPPGTGVFINNEMDDFSAKPLTPNAYGLIGGGANAIAPGKRPLSSMSPSFIESDERLAIIGTPGGSRIISMVLLGMLKFTQGGTAQDIVGLPRFHHQYQPDEILYEPGALRESEKTELEQMGHTLKLSSREYGDMHVIVWDKQADRLHAASDPRGMGKPSVRILPGRAPAD
ncbi:MAG: gamma-glutamyltransferase [Salinisphaeraceae bacterium]|nr:gamma-glutamyltransferase [Salinisphaeraceae bacterium]